MEPSNGYRIDELARRFGLEARGDSTRVIRGVAPLACAEREQLAYLANPRYASELARTRAGVVVLGAEHAGASPSPVLIARDPYLAYARIAALFEHWHPPDGGDRRRRTRGCHGQRRARLRDRIRRNHRVGCQTRPALHRRTGLHRW